MTKINHETFAVNLKCEPLKADKLRAAHYQITPAYHRNKKHWNAVLFEDGLEDILLYEIIDNSYDWVAAKLKKAERQQLKYL